MFFASLFKDFFFKPIKINKNVLNSFGEFVNRGEGVKKLWRRIRQIPLFGFPNTNIEY